MAAAAASSFAMLAGMKLDVFTPLKDGPLSAEEIAPAAGLDPAKTAPLLHALVAIGLLTVDADRFANTPEADQFLGGGSGGLSIALARAWPNLSITIADLPAATPVARRYVDEAGLANRVHVMATDVVGVPLAGSYDVAVIRGVLPGRAPDDAQQLCTAWPPRWNQAEPCT